MLPGQREVSTNIRTAARARPASSGCSSFRTPFPDPLLTRRSRSRAVVLGLVALLVTVSFLARRTGMTPGGGPAGPDFDPADYEDAPVVEAADAASVVGEQAVVCGTVVNAVYAATTGGRPTFLNLERPYPDQPFDAVIWGRDRDRFDRPPEEGYRRLRICVAGEVTTHEGTPRIEVRTPAQITTPGGE